MFTTLDKGRYQPVCDCGAKDQVITIRQRTSKMSLYCWSCKRYQSKFIKVMDEYLQFSTNWNGKLNCQCFTTLRLHNEKRYFAGARFHVLLQGVPKGIATVVQVNKFRINEINEFVAHIDTGYSAKECQKIIREMYKNSPQINWNTQYLDFVLLMYDKNKNEPNLFE